MLSLKYKIQGERKMKKRLYTLISLLLIVSLLILSSCTQNGGQGSSNGGAPNNANTQTNERNISSVFLSDSNAECYSFHNGYAVVYSPLKSSYFIIDTKGVICGETSSKIDDQFWNGVNCIVDAPRGSGLYNSQVAIDTTGSVIYSTQSKDEQIFGITENGNLLIYKTENTVDGMTVSIRVVDKSSQIVVDWVKISEFTDLTTSYRFYAIYLGENIFLIYGEDANKNGSYTHQSFFFNATTGAYTQSGGTTYSELRAASSVFNDGKRVYFQQQYSGDNILVSLDSKTLKTTKIKEGEIVAPIPNDPLPPSCNIARFKDNNLIALGYGNIFDGNNFVGYYDSNLNMKIDLLSKYYRVPSASSFSQGIAVLKIVSKAGASFVVTIDENGNELFPPIEYDGGSAYNDEVIGYILDNTIHFIDKRTGEEISSTPGADFKIGSDGIAIISNEPFPAYIYDYGNQYFDINSGKILFKD